MAWRDLPKITSITHLAICLVAMLGYVAPKLQFLGILWTFINIVDVPFSAVAMMLAWQHEILATIWAVVVGTVWWYILGRGISSAIENRRRAGSGNDGFAR